MLAVQKDMYWHNVSPTGGTIPLHHNPIHVFVHITSFGGQSNSYQDFYKCIGHFCVISIKFHGIFQRITPLHVHVHVYLVFISKDFPFPNTVQLNLKCYKLLHIEKQNSLLPTSGLVTSWKYYI